ncbi:MAG: hypothetical protein Q4Q31_03110 [Bacillota bacterium]|nr:hypothetical protein [Bacillota bacterium]
MKEFLFAALPFILCGLAIIVILMNTKKQTSKDNYLIEGMCLGLVFGSMIGALFSSQLGLCLSLGMLIGEAIGSYFKKDK